MIHIGKNIARIRGFYLIAQKDMAARCCLSQQQYSRLEQTENPDPELLARAAKALQVSAALLERLDAHLLLSQLCGAALHCPDDGTFSQMKLLMELYEQRLAEKDEALQLLRR